ncbi:hypothetical protein ACQPYK_41295 [Streptosporangium sp. CA-135522]|uniref:hypothetical protein n=1 Tax=Streptosporangium sp. CA-135522 TaxID=3240072 RepID=UPI003D9181B9
MALGDGWEVPGAVGVALGDGWEVPGAVGVALGDGWEVPGAVGVALGDGWEVPGAVGVALGDGWEVPGAVGVALGDGWEVPGAVGEVPGAVGKVSIDPGKPGMVTCVKSGAASLPVGAPACWIRCSMDDVRNDKIVCPVNMIMPTVVKTLRVPVAFFFADRRQKLPAAVAIPSRTAIPTGPNPLAACLAIAIPNSTVDPVAKNSAVANDAIAALPRLSPR